MEELGYISPLDNIDPYVTFKQALTGMHPPDPTACSSTHSRNLLTAFQMKNGQSYAMSTTSLSTEQQTLLMEVMRIADTNQGNQA